jgi:hypothetical protein
MNERSEETASGPSHRLVELGLAVFTAVFALIVIVGSLRVGAGWAFDGPQAGFFPFYIGLFVLGASIINFVQVGFDGRRDRPFATWEQLGQVMAVVVPAGVYVGLVNWIGIYIASMLLIAFFMKWLGRYGWRMVLPIAIGVPLATFIVFERWFLVPLPKGPVEAWLGF